MNSIYIYIYIYSLHVYVCRWLTSMRQVICYVGELILVKLCDGTPASTDSLSLISFGNVGKFSVQFTWVSQQADYKGSCVLRNIQARWNLIQWNVNTTFHQKWIRMASNLHTNRQFVSSLYFIKFSSRISREYVVIYFKPYSGVPLRHLVN